VLSAEPTFTGRSPVPYSKRSGQASQEVGFPHRLGDKFLVLKRDEHLSVMRASRQPATIQPITVTTQTCPDTNKVELRSRFSYEGLIKRFLLATACARQPYLRNRGDVDESLALAKLIAGNI